MPQVWRLARRGYQNGTFESKLAPTMRNA